MMFFHILEMTKMTFKVLLRNKFFLFFAIGLVILCTTLLNISITKTTLNKQNEITVLDGLKQQMAYLEDVEKFQVKVYNRSEDPAIESFLGQLTQDGLFQFFEVKSAEYDRETIMEDAEYTALHDKVDAIMVLEESFAQQLKDGKVTDSLTLYQTGADERYRLFEELVTTVLKEVMQLEKLENIQSEYGMEVEAVERKDIVIGELESCVEQSAFDTEVDYRRTSMLGNTLAVYTVAFLFSGIMILGTIQAERDNRVVTRFMLSKASPYSFILSKFVVILATSVMQTILATLSYRFLVKADVGLTLGQFAAILFAMALIFNFMSVGVGICCGNTLTACLASFSVWMLSALLGGMYFDISNASDIYKRIAGLMPQRWGLKVATMFMNGNDKGYPIIIMVAVTYVIVILLIGVLGLRWKSDDHS